MTATLTPTPASPAFVGQSPAMRRHGSMHVGILTQYYPPEVGAPQARLASLAQGLVRREHAVTVLTALPNYPTGMIHPGYGGLLHREQRDGAAVIRSWLHATKRTSIIPRLASYLSFAASSALAGAALMRHPDFLLVESPPLFLGMTGVLLATLKRSRLVFNVSDLWPESAVRLGVIGAGSFGHRMSAALEARCYRSAWLVTGQTQDIVEDIARRFPQVRTHHLPNGVDWDRFGPELADDTARARVRFGRRCTVLYAGLHGLAQGLDQLLDAAAVLPASAGIELVLLGDGPERESLMRRAAAEQLPDVHFLPALPHAEIPASLAAADIVVVPLHRSLTNAVPSKLYEAMASGRPVVLIASGQAAAMVREGEAGLVVPHDDPQALAAALLQLAADPAMRARLGANGRRFVGERSNRSRIADEFIGLLEGACETGERRHA